MTIPTLTPVPLPTPNSAQSDPVFQAAVEARFTWEANFVGEVNDDVLPFMSDTLEQVYATAMSGDLPGLTGQVGKLLQVVSAANPSGVAVGFLPSGATGIDLLDTATPAEARTALQLFYTSGIITPTTPSVLQPDIPADVRWIEITISGLSQSGTGNIIVRPRVAGATVSTGYAAVESFAGSGGAGGAAHTSGFEISYGSAGRVVSGWLRLTRHGTSNTWVASGVFGRAPEAVAPFVSGRVVLSGPLDGIAILAGAGNFNAGSVCINWGL
jgi:hypothetical protein